VSFSSGQLPLAVRLYRESLRAPQEQEQARLTRL